MNCIASITQKNSQKKLAGSVHCPSSIKEAALLLFLHSKNQVIVEMKDMLYGRSEWLMQLDFPNSGKRSRFVVVRKVRHDQKSLSVSIETNIVRIA